MIALDGTQFSLTNTPQITATVTKARTRRGRAAFAKMTAAVLLEVGAAQSARRGHWAAAANRSGRWRSGCWRSCRNGRCCWAIGCMGCGAFAVHARAACERVGSHFLLRASAIDQTAAAQTTPRRHAPGRDRGARPAQSDTAFCDWLEVREIRVRVGRPGHRTHELRLWTSLVDVRTAPALELAQLYAQRWEHELYFRELKRQVRKTDLLQSHTVETAAQEIAALVLVSALLATERLRAAGGQIPVVARELRENPGALCQTDVAVARVGSTAY